MVIQDKNVIYSNEVYFEELQWYEQGGGSLFDVKGFDLYCLC